MPKSFFFLLSSVLVVVMLATGCVGTVNEKDSAAATVLVVPVENSAVLVGVATNLDGMSMINDVVAVMVAFAGSAADVALVITDAMGSKFASKLLMNNEVSGLIGYGVTVMFQANGGVCYVEKKVIGDTVIVAYVTYVLAVIYDDMKNAGKVMTIVGMGQGALFNVAAGILYVKTVEKILLVGVFMNL